MEKVNSIMLMEIYLKENGPMIKLMVTENTFTLTELDIKDNGKTTYNTDKGTFLDIYNSIHRHYINIYFTI